MVGNHWPMNKGLMIFSALMIVVADAAATSAAAQDEAYQRRQRDLIALSTVFGKLHHFRRLCQPGRESQLWRDRMKEVIDYEEPPATTRAAMIKGFNLGFKAVEKDYQTCNRRVDDLATDEASRGEAIIASLKAPLYRTRQGSNAR